MPTKTELSSQSSPEQRPEIRPEDTWTISQGQIPADLIEPALDNVAEIQARQDPIWNRTTGKGKLVTFNSYRENLGLDPLPEVPNMSFAEWWEDTKLSWENLVPYLGGFFEGAELWKTKQSIDRIKTNKASREDWENVLDHQQRMVREMRHASTWTKAADLATHSLPYAVEFATTTGGFTLARKGGMKATRAAVGKSLKMGLDDIVEALIRGQMGKLPKALVATAAMGAIRVAAPPSWNRLYANVKHRLVPESQFMPVDPKDVRLIASADDKQLWDVLPTAVKDEFIEQTTEMMGLQMGRLTGKAKDMVFGSLLALNPNRWNRFKTMLPVVYARKVAGSWKKAMQKVEKAGIHGIVGEIAEEDLAMLWRAAPLLGTGEAIPDMQTLWDQHKAMGVAFAGMRFVPGFAMLPFGMRASRRLAEVDTPSRRAFAELGIEERNAEARARGVQAAKEEQQNVAQDVYADQTDQDLAEAYQRAAAERERTEPQGPVSELDVGRPGEPAPAGEAAPPAEAPPEREPAARPEAPPEAARPEPKRKARPPAEAAEPLELELPVPELSAPARGVIEAKTPKARAAMIDMLSEKEARQVAQEAEVVSKAEIKTTPIETIKQRLKQGVESFRERVQEAREQQARRKPQPPTEQGELFRALPEAEREPPVEVGEVVPPSVPPSPGIKPGLRRVQAASAEARAARVPVAPLEGEAKRPDQIVYQVGRLAGGTLERAKKMPRRTKGLVVRGSRFGAVRFGGDIPTIAHELGHLLDENHGILKNLSEGSSPYDAELEGFAEHSINITDDTSLDTVRAEGEAEFTLAYLINPQEAKRRAPKFYEYFESEIPAKNLRALRQFGNEIRVYATALETRPLETGNIVTDPMAAKQEATKYVELPGVVKETWWDRLNRHWIDPMHVVWKTLLLSRMSRVLPTVRPTENFRLMWELQLGHDPRVQTLMDTAQYVDWETQEIVKVPGFNSFADIFQTQGQKETVMAQYYMVAQKTMEQNAVLNKAADDLVAAKEAMDEAAEQLKEMRETNTGTKEEKDALRAEIRSAASEIRRLAKKLNYTGKKLDRKTLGKHIHRRMERFSGVGAFLVHDVEQAKRAIESFGRLPQAAQKRIRQTANRYRKWADWLLQQLRDEGFISQEEYQRIRKENVYYVDMHRVFRSRAEGGLGIEPDMHKYVEEFYRTPGIKPLKVRKGSDRTIDNIFLNLIVQTDVVMRKVWENRAMKALAVELSPGRSKRKIHGQVVTVDNSQIGAVLPEFFENMFHFWDKGKQYSLKLDPVLYDAMREAQRHIPKRGGAFAGFVKGAVRLRKDLITHMPDFIVRNYLRAVAHQPLISRVGTQPWHLMFDLVRYVTPGARTEFKKLMQQNAALGGHMLGYWQPSKKAHNQMLAKGMKDAAIRGDSVLMMPFQLPFAPVKIAYRALNRLGVISEMLGRNTEWRRAERFAARKYKHMDKLDRMLYASWESRNLQDWGVVGTKMQELGPYLMFVNAAIRGIHRTIDFIQDRPVTFAIRMMYLPIALTMFEYLWNVEQGDDDEWAQQPEYLQDLFWNYKIAPNVWIRVPKGWELGALSSLAGRGLRYADGDKNSFDGFMPRWGDALRQNEIGSLLRSFLPADESVLFGPFITIAEIMLNYDFFRDRPIKPQYTEGLRLDRDKGTRWSSNLSKRVNNLLQLVYEQGVDPRYIDHFIENQFGGLGRRLVQTTYPEEMQSNRLGFWLENAGVANRSPAYSSRDVRWMFDWSRAMGLDGSKPMQELRRLGHEYYDAIGNEAKDDAARKLREYATNFRNKQEQAISKFGEDPLLLVRIANKLATRPERPRRSNYPAPRAFHMALRDYPRRLREWEETVDFERNFLKEKKIDTAKLSRLYEQYLRQRYKQPRTRVRYMRRFHDALRAPRRKIKTRD